MIAFHQTSLSLSTITLPVSFLLSDCIVRRNLRPLTSEILLIKLLTRLGMIILRSGIWKIIYKIMIGLWSDAILFNRYSSQQNERKWLRNSHYINTNWDDLTWQSSNIFQTLSTCHANPTKTSIQTRPKFIEAKKEIERQTHSTTSNTKPMTRNSLTFQNKNSDTFNYRGENGHLMMGTGQKKRDRSTEFWDHVEVTDYDYYRTIILEFNSPDGSSCNCYPLLLFHHLPVPEALHRYHRQILPPHRSSVSITPTPAAWAPSSPQSSALSSQPSSDIFTLVDFLVLTFC